MLIGHTNSIPNTCSFDGNTDLYGIGVRVGLYLQWTTTLLTTIFSPGEEGIIRAMNLLIQSAIFLGLVLITGRHEIHAIEPVISILLTFGALSSLTGSGMNPIGHVSGVYRVVLYTGIAGYACWFWFSGLDGLLSAEGGCTPVAFFGHVSIDGRFQTFNEVASVLGLITSVVFVIWCITSFGLKSNVFVNWRVAYFGKGCGASTGGGRSRVQIPFLVLSAGIIGLSIAVVEYLLVVNGITGVNRILSVGQFIPLLAGTFGFAEFLWNLVHEDLLFKPRCWIIFGHHLS